MTDEKLDQFLKQALSPEIEDSEIQIQRKVVNNKMKTKKKIITGALVACAALTFVVTGGYFSYLSKSGDDKTSNVTKAPTALTGNVFAITSNAAVLPEGFSSGDVINLSTSISGYGSSDYLDGRFAISGNNIQKVKVETDKCNLYTVVPIYEGDPEYKKAQNIETFLDGEWYEMISDVPEDKRSDDIESMSHHYEHLLIRGTSYEGTYNDKMSFGMSVPEELWSTNDDLQAGFHEDVDQVDGATITIEVTFVDGSIETHHYKLKTGKIFIPVDENGYNQYDNLTRFATDKEAKKGNIYGYLMEKID